MIGRIIRLVRAEFIKVTAHPFLYVSLGLLALTVFCAQSWVPIIKGQTETVWRSFHSVQLFVYGFDFGYRLATIILLVFSSMMFAGEFDRGTIKNMLTRPISRTDFFAAKCVTMLLLAVLFYAFLNYVSLFLAFMGGDLGPVWDDELWYIHRGAEEITGRAWETVAVSFVPLLAVGFLGLLVSNWTESSGFAVAISLVIYMFAFLLEGLLSEDLRRLFFFYYAPEMVAKLTELAQGGSLRWPLEKMGRQWWAVPATYIGCFIPAAYVIFRSRNITT